ncbi:UDP-4-amino-4,6-dideoxy-N-acetyl-beta-L-altrosamine transaminase [Candidatus Falkowbacteria bacterium CG10_big_fil_rev_8_21_14_0_10_43_11]|uniref:UDP-4-amino-4, 6-dideoxy-N-acetyl-beta-L-altrosamine transaminase n=1 Tax=Candidatus Falkowbacteria bacterium CG10_big_fil_rev_8_21_14_0_10_43_11 TaxID=1974568 RepID=A0A2M6WM03_9BACT|nr:MAG: UDP-4-amino-4,6-dideoxy-N-acetyl-beta-L-altrosamine transaminase [Candidatus Falkowbacteria bacterium CG10_big_fil_rev_8_21_14_0_10_43_11]
MIPYGKQYIDRQDINAVTAVLRSDWLTQGPKILEFEQKLAKYCGAKYAVAVNNGTAALHLAYQAAGLKAGDEVITTPNTFIATTNMLLALKVKPVFCDIREDTNNINEFLIEKLVTKKTKAIVPVHLAGHPCKMEKIHQIANKHKLLVIEDACHALGAKYKQTKIGACRYSDLAVFSFHPVKPITTGEGGAVLTNNKKYYQKLMLLRSHGIRKDKKGFNVMTELGYNYRLTDIQAALGISQLDKLDKFIKERHQIVKWYEQSLTEIKQIILPLELKNCYSGWHLYIIKTKNKQDRLPLYQHLKDGGVGVNFHYPCVYRHPYYQRLGFSSARCAIAENYEKTAITLPIHCQLTKKEVFYITTLIKDFF